MNCRSRLRTGLIRALLAPLLLCAVTPAAAADDYPFKVESRSDGRQYRLVAINGGRAPIYVKVALTKFENMDSSRPWPIRQLVAPGQTVELNRLYAADPARAYSFNFKHSWLYGDPAAKPDPNAKYRLPFADGLAFRIHQAPGGPLTTHDNIYSREAVDIIMPVGTPVVAARAGYVIVNIRPYDTGKLEPDYLDKANLVRIMHDDGTWSDYLHLQKYSSNVVAGMRVEAGTQIGLSGSSGYSSEPHLHFVVQRSDGEQAVSVPFRFWTRAGGSFAPVYMSTVTADYGGNLAGTAASATIRTAAPQAQPVAARPKPRPVKACMGGKNVIDEAVLRCTQGL